MESNRIFSKNTRGGEDDYLNLVWEMGHGTEIGEENSIISVDVDNDGTNEVVFGNDEGFLHIIQYFNDDFVDEWKSTDLGSPVQGLTSGDVDNDGIIEIVAGTGYGELIIIGYQQTNGSYMVEWMGNVFAFDILGLAAGDVDNDGFMEIIAGTTSYAEIPVPNIHIFEFDGSTYNLEWVYWAEDSYFNFARSVAIGDTDNDGSLEFVVGISEYKYATQTPRGSFYVFGYNNGVYTMEWKRDDSSVDVIDIDIGDVDSDGLKEIVVGSGMTNIYGYDSGSYHIENSIAVGFANVQVGNVNDDNVVEIVVSSGEYLSIWQQTTEIWESDDLISYPVDGIYINDIDDNLYNEIVISFGSFYEESGVMVFEFDGSDFILGWRSQYIMSVYSIFVEDVDLDSAKELILGMDSGNIYFYGYQNGEYLFEDSIQLPFEDSVEHVYSYDFDNDGQNEIAAIIYDEIYFIKYLNENYVEIDVIDLADGYANAVDCGDVDGDGLQELVVGLSGGYLKVIGYDGSSYIVEWENQIYTGNINSIGIGDTDDNGGLEIVLGGYDIDIVFTEYRVKIWAYDGSTFIEKWIYQTDGRIDALDVGDSDNDNINELVFMNGSSDLYIYGWDGSTYDFEWSTSDFYGIYDNCLDISKIELNSDNRLIIAQDELFVLSFDTTYEYLWQSDTINFNIECIFVGDSDGHGTNEIVASIGAYLFIYGIDIWPTASLFVSKTEVKVGESITFDGSNSNGMGSLEYFFDFGDGSDSGWIVNPTTTHSYSSEGQYTASLTIKDENGNQSTNPTDISIKVMKPNIPPRAYIDYISPDSAKEGDDVSFSGHGSDEDGIITSYWWESSIDGYLSTSNSFTSQLSSGIHSIYFRVMDDDNTWSENVIETIEIEPEVQNKIPIAYIDSIIPNQGFEGDTISFSGHGIDDDGSIVKYLWESDLDGELSDQSDFSTSSLSIGSHLISFKVQDDEDAWSEAVEGSILIKAIPPNKFPEAHIDTISPNPAKEGEIISFSGHGDDEDGSIEAYLWESNSDGFLSSKRSFSTSEISVGEHIIAFKVKDDDNEWSEPVTMALNVKGGEKESDEFPVTIFFGLIVLIICIIIVTALVLYMMNKTTSGTSTTICPNCSSVYKVLPSERPITVQCPICDYIAMIY